MPGKHDAWMVPAHPGSVLKKNRKQKMHTYGTYRHRGPDGLIVLQRNDALLMPRMCSDVSQRAIRQRCRPITAHCSARLVDSWGKRVGQRTALISKSGAGRGCRFWNRRRK